MTRFQSASLVLLVGCTSLVSSAYAQAASKAEVTKLLQQSAKEFLAVIEDVNETQWTFKGNGMRHSIGEEAEHVAAAEQDLQQVILKALKAPADAAQAKQLQGKEATVRKLMLDAAKGAENFRPLGRLGSKPEVLEYFGMAHKKLLQLLAGAAELDTHVFKHPSKDYGDLTALQWFYYIGYHKMRHCTQIEAIKASQEYPGRVRKASLGFVDPADPGPYATGPFTTGWALHP
jgi:hypothetical protein